MTKGYKLVITHFLRLLAKIVMYVATAHITATLYWPQPLSNQHVQIQSNRERDGHVQFILVIVQNVCIYSYFNGSVMLYCSK